MMIHIPLETPSKKNSRVVDRRTGRTFPNRRYTEWHKAAALYVRQQNAHPLDGGPFALYLEFTHGDLIYVVRPTNPIGQKSKAVELSTLFSSDPVQPANREGSVLIMPTTIPTQATMPARTRRNITSLRILVLLEERICELRHEPAHEVLEPVLLADKVLYGNPDLRPPAHVTVYIHKAAQGAIPIYVRLPIYVQHAAHEAVVLVVDSGSLDTLARAPAYLGRQI